MSEKNMIVNVNGFKIKICNVKYETDDKEVIKGHAEVNLFYPRLGWLHMGDVEATVGRRDDDIFNEETGKKLVFNALQKKALNRFKRKVEFYFKDLVKQMFEADSMLQRLEYIEDEIELNLILSLNSSVNNKK